MLENDKRSEHPRRRTSWVLLLIVFLVAILLWWLSRLNVPVRVAEPAIVEESVVNSDSATEPEPEKEASDADVSSIGAPPTNRVSTPSIPPIEISGRVMLLGTPPEERVLLIQTNRDGSIRKTMSRDYEVSAERGLANVFVYVESGLGSKKFAPPKGILRLTEITNFLEPFMVGAQVDQPIEIENFQIHHQYRLVSSRGTEFPWKRNERGVMEDTLELVFSERDIFSRLTCKAHPWEWAYFGVVAHPYFAVTDKNGYFKLPKGIPPGDYKIAVQHPKAGKAVRPVVAAAGGKYDLLFQLRPKRPDTNTLAGPVTQVEGESLEDRDSSAEMRSGADAHEGFSEGAPIIGKEAAPPGVIRGQVRLRGTPPPEKPLDVVKDNRACGRIIDVVPNTRFYVTGEDAGLADTVVYLESEALSKGNFRPPGEPLLLDQVKCEYTPYVAAIQAGQKLLVRNSDPLMHNVHPTPTVTGNKEANKVQMPNAADLEFVFEKPEAFLRFKCDVHPWMISYVSVFNHPFFAVTDANGRFSITNVPPGKYQLHVMHRKAGTNVVNELVITKGRGKDIGLTLEAK